MSNENDRSEPERGDEGRAELAAAELKIQMSRLKARYRVERRLLETRSFDSGDDA